MTAEEFKNTVMPHHRKMTGVAIAILGDAEDVRDCMQDTLSKLWMIRGELGHKVNIEAYCMRTVRNNSLTILKRRRNDDSAIPDLEERLNPEVMLENKDRLAKVLKGTCFLITSFCHPFVMLLR